MDEQEFDLTIIEATDEYRPRHKAGPRNIESRGTEDPERSSLESRVAQLEADVESWQRRTVMWRERALSAQALNEALNTNLDDLRVVVRAMATTHPPDVGLADAPRSQLPARQPTSTTVVEWCNSVFRREFWTGRR
jgi:hypothetical protein